MHMYNQYWGYILLARIFCETGRSSSRVPVQVLVGEQAAQKIASKCFSGEKRAGSFIAWDSLNSLFACQWFLEAFQETLEELLKEPEAGEFRSDCSWSYKYPKAVGWSITVPKEYAQQQGWNLSSRLRTISNNGTQAQFVADAGHRQLYSPQSRVFTVVFNLERKARGWEAKIHSLYVGPDLGEWEGNLTEKTNRVWLFGSTPGGPDLLEEED